MRPATRSNHRRRRGVGVLLALLVAMAPPALGADETATAKTFGLALDGVRLGPGDPTPGRPAIVFVRDEDKGSHFAVIRPVGSTGTMVQVIDPPGVPWIGD